MGARSIVAAFFVSLTAPALATDDIQQGAAKAATYCGSCHGVTGVGQDPAYPKLAGQFGDYMVKQIADSKAGRRSDARIKKVAAEHHVPEVELIAAYYASRPAFSPEPVEREEWPLAQEGHGLYTGSLNCFQCHGEEGAGALGGHLYASVPRVAGQYKKYLVKVLRDFRSGSRTNDPSGMMASISAMLSDQEIEALAVYMSGLPATIPPPEPPAAAGQPAPERKPQELPDIE